MADIISSFLDDEAVSRENFNARVKQINDGAEPALSDAAEKATPADADAFALVDSADSKKTKGITWGNTKIALGETFAGLDSPAFTGTPKLNNVAIATTAQMFGRNLLLNSDFSINQRGQSTYTKSDAYSLDRWRFSSGLTSVVVADDYVRITGRGHRFLSQLIESPQFLSDKTVTLSIIARAPAGQVFSLKLHNFTAPDGPFADFTGTGEFKMYTQTLATSTISKGDSVALLIYPARYDTVDGYVDLRRGTPSIKLELGSISTLACDAPPDPTVELVRCQRYYQTFKTIALVGRGSSSTQASFTLPLAAQLRRTPTLSDATGDYWRVQDASGNNKTPIAMAVYATGVTSSFIVIHASAPAGLFVPGELYSLTKVGAADFALDANL